MDEQKNQIEITDKETDSKLNDIKEPEPVEPVEPEEHKSNESVELVENKSNESVEPEEHESNESEEPLVSKPKSDYVQIIELIKLMLTTNDKFNELVAKAKITIDINQSNQIKNILNYLIGETENNENAPIDNVIQEALKILSDNKVELYEIPSLIDVIHESFKNLPKSIRITTQDIGILIKFVLFILLETKTVKVSNEDYELISKVIDSSMILLNKSVEIKIPKFNKCLCF